MGPIKTHERDPANRIEIMGIVAHGAEKGGSRGTAAAPIDRCGGGIGAEDRAASGPRVTPRDRMTPLETVPRDTGDAGLQ